MNIVITLHQFKKNAAPLIFEAPHFLVNSNFYFFSTEGNTKLKNRCNAFKKHLSNVLHQSKAQMHPQKAQMQPSKAQFNILIVLFAGAICTFGL